MKIDLRLGDCLEVLKTIPDNSIDSVVTDPPYHLTSIVKRFGKEDSAPAQFGTDGAYARASKGFMGKEWDGGDIAFRTDVWSECLRVLKPGGHLLAFSHSRTYHRMGVAIEDAGFEIRDQIMWVYGSGFPKSHNIGKAIDKIEGNDREVVGETKAGKTALGQNSGWNQHENRTEIEVTKGNSEWEGWGTALKPAHEPIVMARKPLTEKSIAENVLKYGTGGINIDGSRIPFEDTQNAATNPKFRKENNYKMPEPGQESNGAVSFTSSKNEYDTSGRFPANIIFDEEAGQLLDEQSGISKSSKHKWEGDNNAPIYGKYEKGIREATYDDKGGASRFFYCPKAAKKDRNEGLDHLEDKIGDTNNQAMRRLKCSNCDNWYVAGDKSKECKCEEPNWIEPSTKNNHPTVKPTDLMRYLINLITPPNGTTLDPFMGSGSTGKAAVRCGVNFIGIEKEQEYMDIASARIQHEQNKPLQTKLF
jgi:site-specific DNA-methyltransferase (adenine-specific)